MKRHKGLKRHGMRSYWLRGFIITRDRPWRWWVRHERYGAMPMDFFAIKCPTLDAAVRWVRFNGPAQYVSQRLKPPKKDFKIDPREAVRRARRQEQQHGPE